MAPAITSPLPPLSSLAISPPIRESRSLQNSSPRLSRTAFPILLPLLLVLLFADRLTPPAAALPHYGAVPGGSCPMNNWSDNGYWGVIEARAHAALAAAQEWRGAANEALGRVEPLQLLVAALLAAVVGGKLAQVAGAAGAQIRSKGLVPTLTALFFSLIRLLPGVKAFIQEQQDKARAQIVGGSSSRERAQWRKRLPDVGAEAEEVLGEMRALRDKDKAWQGRCSGTVYVGGESYEKHMKLIADAYTMFQHTNPLHPDVFPSITRFEAEVVAMTAALLGGGSHPEASWGDGGSDSAANGEENGGGKGGAKGAKGVKRGEKAGKGGGSGGEGGLEVCGNVTSGGSESILMAVKASRDYMRAKKGITRPEMIVPVSAHAAYDKAAEYFQVQLLRAPVADDWCVEVDAVRRLCTRNTVLIVASAPGFPHGIIDPIPELGEIAARWGTCLHVDCCLGGFVLPFAKKLGYPLPPFDFSVPGVTSISVDCHKYGLAPKGTSVVLYRNREIRKHQFCAVTEWSGGLYVSPSVSGSRSGALIAGAWAAMRSIGMQGYMDITRRLMEASKAVAAGISRIKGVHVVGQPDMTVVALASDHLDIYRVNDAMSQKGWALSALHKPASIHLCVTLQHVDAVDTFLADLQAAVDEAAVSEMSAQGGHVDAVDTFLPDLQAAVDEVRLSPSPLSQGMAPIYGAGNRMPDRGAVKELLLDYMDSLT
ncbi:hypothetical protein CLOP_g14906 [Closterium sp. NIES-67]|nr:hypothetical protein CLOP_g14906 [Closterium sp. NIES-67]